MDAEEMMYVEGGKIVCTLKVGRTTCQKVYNKMGLYNGWTQLAVSTIAGLLSVGAGVLSGIVGIWYNSVRGEFQKGGYYKGYHGVKILFYDTGSTPAVISY